MILSKFAEMVHMEADNIKHLLRRLTNRAVFYTLQHGSRARWHIRDVHADILASLVQEAVPYEADIEEYPAHNIWEREVCREENYKRRVERMKVIVSYMRRFDYGLDMELKEMAAYKEERRKEKLLDKKEFHNKANKIVAEVRETLKKLDCRTASTKFSQAKRTVTITFKI